MRVLLIVLLICLPLEMGLAQDVIKTTSFGEVHPESAEKTVLNDQKEKSKNSNPSYTSTQLDKAEQLYNQGSEFFGAADYTNAILKFKEVLKIQPENFITNVLCSYALCIVGRGSEAKPYADMAFQEQLFDLEGSSVSQYYYLAIGNFERAKDFTMDAVRRNTRPELLDYEGDWGALSASGHYDNSLIDKMRAYLKSIYTDELTARDASWKAFQAAQSVSDPATKVAAYSEVLRQERALKAPRYAVIGAALADKAQILSLQHRYEEALPLQKEAIENLEAYMDIPILCQAYRNAASCYLELSKIDEAIDMAQKSIDLANKYNITDGLAMAYANLGNAYAKINEYNKAVNYLVYAREIAKDQNDKAGIATVANNIGSIYAEQGQYVSAVKYFEQAMVGFKELGDKYSQAFTMSNYAETLLRNGESETAITIFNQADQLYADLGETYQRGALAKYRAVALANQGKYTEAEKAYNMALNNVGASKENTLVAAIYTGLGNCAFATDKMSAAIDYADKAIAINEKLTTNASEMTKRGLFSKNHDMYMLKSLSHFRAGDYATAFQAKEESRSQILREKISSKTRTVLASEVPAMIGSDAALIDFNLFSRPEYYKQSWFFPVVISDAGVKGKEFTDQNIRAIIHQQFDEEFSDFRGSQIGLDKHNQASRAGYSTADPNIPLSNELQFAIETYRDYLSINNPADEDVRKEMAKNLYTEIIKPIESLFSDKKELFIIPDGVLAFLPFETLINDEGKYLGEVYSIRYVQSASVLKELQSRQYADNRKPLIAFGNPVYEDVAEVEVEKYRSLNTEALQTAYDKIAEAGGSQRPTYIQLGVTSWNQLPGTLAEVQKIGEIVSNSVIHTGENASEESVKAKDQSGELADYKVIHFATHGFAFAAIPEMSAVILGQYENPRKEDGYLSIGEIEELNIKADLVALSACQTGLGKSYRGEGVQGLTQAFLIAGANGMAVSLWSVDDAGTAKFMSEVYNDVYNEGKTFAAAFTDVKREFISGTYGDRLAHPSIWAPFVYYGK